MTVTSAPGRRDGEGVAPPRPPLPSQIARLPRPPRPRERPVTDPELTAPADDPPVQDPAAQAAAVHAPVADDPDAAESTRQDAPSEVPAVDAGADPWGRVDEDGTVYLRTPDGERAVGSWQVGEPAQALAFYRRRYDALVVEVDLLERRIRSGALAPDDATASIRRARDNLQSAQVVGDLPALQTRLDRLQEVIEARRAQRKAERAKAVEAARASKEALVAEAEAIAQGSDWRNAADRLRAMLDKWKALPRLDRRVDDELWHRFSAARTTYTRRRRTHFADLASKRDDAKGEKERLVTEAETLAVSTDWGPTAARYRALMTQWKAAGPAPRADEDVLWQRFRAAQDVFFVARSSTLSERDSTEKESLQTKERLLAEAEALLPVTDIATAKAALRSIQDRWEAAGRAPRDATARIEGRLRKVEEAVRAREQVQWQRPSPEALARAEATVAQLRTSVEKLERQASAEESAGSGHAAAEARAAVATRRSWLVEAEKTLAELRS